MHKVALSHQLSQMQNEHTVTCIQPGVQLHKMHTTILTKEGARIFENHHSLFFCIVKSDASAQCSTINHSQDNCHVNMKENLASHLHLTGDSLAHNSYSSKVFHH